MIGKPMCYLDWLILCPVPADVQPVRLAGLTHPHFHLQSFRTSHSPYLFTSPPNHTPLAYTAKPNKQQEPNTVLHNPMSEYPPRPQTPQAMLHRLPDKPDEEQLSLQRAARPTKYIVLITASTAVAGKVQIAKSVATTLTCPLFQGDSLHETAAKAAGLGAAEPNETRYQRMWLSKMTRTGLLFPDESRPANEGFSGFGGASSASWTEIGRAHV